MKAITRETKKISIIIMMLLFAGLTANTALGSSLLGFIDGSIGGGQFTTSTEVPTGISVSYGYGMPNGTYVFDDYVFTGPDEVTLGQNDDPQFVDIATALIDGVPGGETFYVGLGFHPSPPFLLIASYFGADPIPIADGFIIESLALTIGAFEIISTPAPGDETLWEVPNINYRISAYGSSTPIPEPSTFLLLGSGLTALAFVSRRRKKG